MKYFVLFDGAKLLLFRNTTNKYYQMMKYVC